MLGRRQWLALGAAASVGSPWLAACDGANHGTDVPRYSGGWVGADAARGHWLRAHQAARKSGALPLPATTRRVGVLIVGAGIAGLSCARSLVSSSVDDVHVLDLEDTAGGNSRAHTLGGMACPLGAHYLPLPDEHNPELTEWLAELKLCRFEHGRWVFDERHLCHSPQERIFMPGIDVASAGQWFDGLLPPIEALPSAQQAPTLAQYQRFAALVQALPSSAFVIPTARSNFTPELQALDAQTFATWLDAQGLTAPALRWYLDYCCRDDYGAGSAQVSAWAGLHYFASRHGFHAPGSERVREESAVLTWPQGNAWLTEKLTAALGPDRLHSARVALQVDESRHEVSVLVWNDRAQQLEQWVAKQAVLATPLFISQRLLRSAPQWQSALQTVGAQMRYAPWLVANLQLNTALQDHPGAPPSWDSVVYGSPALGYVDAMHQSFRPHAGPTVLTSYWALGGDNAGVLQQQRDALLNQPWQHWAARVMVDLATAHPDLPRKVQRVDLMRYGHAMSVPSPGVRSSAALAALAALAVDSSRSGRVQLAHSDLSGYSIFEEAFFQGQRAANQVKAWATSGR